MNRTLATLLASALLLDPAAARPVSYEGGWTAIEETDRQATSLWVHYTVDPRLSIGWRTEWDRRRDAILNAPQATLLVRRWFGADYQANVYAFGGAGLASGDDRHGSGAAGVAYAGVLADWETRRLFLSYRNRVISGGPFGDAFMQAGRAGFAPYVGDTGDLHTWLMVEVDHRPANPEELGVTPLVRFFKGAALLELGWSVGDDQPLANFTYRF